MVHTTLRPARRRYRALFVSDLHLGARGCCAEDFLEFLRGIEAETIYLVGDILDIWHPGRLHWGAAQDAIIADLMARQRAGVRVVYLPGNHDAALRDGRTHFGAFELHDRLTHEAADGTRYLVLHGDQVDARILRWHIMTRIGSRCDAGLRGLDAWLRRNLRSNAERGVFELAISGVNALMMMGNGFRRRLAALARAGGHDGVICGHFHKAALTVAEGITYANCGDWVDSLTALVEAEDGSLRMLAWAGAEAAQGAWAGVAEEVLP